MSPERKTGSYGFITLPSVVNNINFGAYAPFSQRDGLSNFRKNREYGGFWSKIRKFDFCPKSSGKVSVSLRSGISVCNSVCDVLGVFASVCVRLRVFGMVWVCFTVCERLLTTTNYY